MGMQPVGRSMLGVILAVAGGVAMSVSTMQCRALNDAGVRPGLLFPLRYPLTAVAAGILALMSPPGISDTTPEISTLMAIAALLILVPSYINQVAISLASPLTVRVVMAGAPVIVFLLETIEGRLWPSLYSLAAAMLYALFAILAGLARQRAILTMKITPMNADFAASADRRQDVGKLADGSDWPRKSPL